MVKSCSCCSVEKPLEEFHNSSRSSDGKQSQCKNCARIASNEWRRRNRSVAASNMGQYRQTWGGAVRERYHNAHHRARERSYEFTITQDYILNLLSQQNYKCALTGDDLSFVSGNPKKLSLDRKDNSKGYEIENVQWVTWEVNNAKGKLSDAEFINLCRKVCVTESSETIPEGST